MQIYNCHFKREVFNIKKNKTALLEYQRKHHETGNCIRRFYKFTFSCDPISKLNGLPNDFRKLRENHFWHFQTIQAYLEPRNGIISKDRGCFYFIHELLFSGQFFSRENTLKTLLKMLLPKC